MIAIRTEQRSFIVDKLSNFTSNLLLDFAKLEQSKKYVFTES